MQHGSDALRLGLIVGLRLLFCTPSRHVDVLSLMIDQIQTDHAHETCIWILDEHCHYSICWLSGNLGCWSPLNKIGHWWPGQIWAKCQAISGSISRIAVFLDSSICYAFVHSEWHTVSHISFQNQSLNNVNPVLCSDYYTYQLEQSTLTDQ